MKSRKMKIGSYLIDQGLISPEQGRRILQIQSKDENYIKKRFGRIAIDQGYLSEHDISKAFMRKMQMEDGLL